MYTPNGKYNYNSPYATPVQHYRSQSEDYISLDMGGPLAKSCPASSSNDVIQHRNNLKYYQQNYRNSSLKANKRNLFNNNYGQQNNRHSFHQQRFAPRKSFEGFQHQKKNSNNYEKKSNDKNDNSIASYCHPSMTEDPWLALTARIKALEKSKISTKESSPTPEPTFDPNSDNDKEDNIDS